MKKTNQEYGQKQEQKKEERQTDIGRQTQTDASSSSAQPAEGSRSMFKKILYLAVAVLLAVLLGVFSPQILQQSEPAHSADPTNQSQSVGAENTGDSGTKPSDDKTAGTKPTTADTANISYRFRNSQLLQTHYDKHGKEMGFASAAEYEAAAAKVANNTAALHKKEAEDGDDVYYLEKTNEFVIISTDGYIRTYFNPSDGIRYYNRQ